MRRVVVLGASGIVGQHMILLATHRRDVEALFFRRTPGDGVNPGIQACDLTTADGQGAVLALEPDVIVNLAGESSPDVVEREPRRYEDVNVALPVRLATWAHMHERHYLHVSTQGVFSGNEPPYSSFSKPSAVNAYGRQKTLADILVSRFGFWTIARLTFVLGLRPFPQMGRMNPLEQMFREDSQRQTDDRMFSPLLAEDAAEILWELALGDLYRRRIVHLGEPITVTRYVVACHARDLVGGSDADVTRVSHADFPGIAPRPRDTTWRSGSLWKTPLAVGLARCAEAWKARGRHVA